MEEAVANVLMSDNHEAVINQAMELHGQALLELVYSYVQDRELAEDLTQEIFIKCYQKLHQYNGKAKFKTWLWQIAINHCRDYLKSWYNRNIVISEEHAGAAASTREAVENEVVAKDEQEYLAQAVMSLSAPYREAIYLHYYEELAIKEISYVTGLNQNTVKTRLKRARVLLKESLEG
ncbi:sigma-70 family RNA polymerase sigma factor [Bacillus cereus]|uniref:sigma-70 family RNA polymerase sigma factor n=1 Tax=Bacillus cereus TaxID=1396 RepID=UPI000BF662FF|nr:sigma-70 family RNA polymerase sigma factor [Bacillus cereus]PFO80061.1 RNA polymerase factor sigma C [Bacillus cereus]